MDKTAFRKQLYSDKSEEAWLHSTWRDTSHQNNNIYTFFCFWLLNKGHRKCSLVDKSVDFFLFFSCSNPQPRSSSNLTVNTCSRKCLNELTWNAIEQNPTEAPQALRLKKKKKKRRLHIQCTVEVRAENAQGHESLERRVQSLENICIHSSTLTSATQTHTQWTHNFSFYCIALIGFPFLFCRVQR